jgi:hypothetical protein
MNLENLNHGDTVRIARVDGSSWTAEYLKPAEFDKARIRLDSGESIEVSTDIVLCRVEEVYTEPQAGEVPVKGCRYEIYQNGAVSACDMPADDSGLCPEHLAFVTDNTQGPFTASRKAHPAGYNWLLKARNAYGVVSPNMKPSDAGKQPSPFDPRDIAAWDARAIRYRILDGLEVPFSVLPPRQPVMFSGIMEATPMPEEKPGEIPVEWTRETIESVCRRIMENKEEYKGTGISPILWSIGFRAVYQNRPASDKQIAAVRSIVEKQPDKYLPIFEA